MISLGVIILFSVYCGAACNDHPGRAPLNPTIKPYAKNVKAVKKVLISERSYGCIPVSTIKGAK